MVRFLPREQVIQDFVENDTATPHVAFDCVGLARENLRRHVDRCSCIEIESTDTGPISWTILGFLIT